MLEWVTGLTATLASLHGPHTLVFTERLPPSRAYRSTGLRLRFRRWRERRYRRQILQNDTG